MRGCSGGRRSVLAMIAGLVVLGGCTSGPAEPRSQLRGASVEVVGSWTGVEQQRFTAVLRHFAAATGARVHYTGVAGYLAEAIDTRLARRRPPDVALLPQPGLLRRYALAGALVPLDATARRLVREHYGPVWRDLASVPAWTCRASEVRHDRRLGSLAPRPSRRRSAGPRRNV